MILSTVDCALQCGLLLLLEEVTNIRDVAMTLKYFTAYVIKPFTSVDLPEDLLKRKTSRSDRTESLLRPSPDDDVLMLV